MDKVKLFQDIRLQLNDTDKLEFQDSELQSALTACLFEIEKNLMSVNSPLLLKKITLSSSETTLDNNLLRIVSAYNTNTKTYLRLSSNEIISDNEYKIYGSKIIINKPPVVLNCYVKSDDVILNSFYDIIVDYIVSVCRARIENNQNLELQALTVLLSRVKSYSYGLFGVPVVRRYNNYSV